MSIKPSNISLVFLVIILRTSVVIRISICQKRRPFGQQICHRLEYNRWVWMYSRWWQCRGRNARRLWRITSLCGFLNSYFLILRCTHKFGFPSSNVITQEEQKNTSDNVCRFYCCWKGRLYFPAKFLKPKLHRIKSVLVNVIKNYYLYELPVLLTCSDNI